MDLESREAVWAVVENGLVVNTIVWDGESEWLPPEGTTLVSLAEHPYVGIDWDYVDGEFVDNRTSDEEE